LRARREKSLRPLGSSTEVPEERLRWRGIALFPVLVFRSSHSIMSVSSESVDLGPLRWIEKIENGWKCTHPSCNSPSFLHREARTVSLPSTSFDPRLTIFESAACVESPEACLQRPHEQGSSQSFSKVVVQILLQREQRWGKQHFCRSTPFISCGGY